MKDSWVLAASRVVTDMFPECFSTVCKGKYSLAIVLALHRWYYLVSSKSPLIAKSIIVPFIDHCKHNDWKGTFKFKAFAWALSVIKATAEPSSESAKVCSICVPFVNLTGIIFNSTSFLVEMCKLICDNYVLTKLFDDSRLCLSVGSTIHVGIASRKKTRDNFDLLKLKTST